MASISRKASISIDPSATIEIASGIGRVRPAQDFPFTDLSAAMQRRVLVLTQPTAYGDFIAAQVTSQLHHLVQVASRLKPLLPGGFHRPGGLV